MSPPKPKDGLDELDIKILKVIQRWINTKGIPPTVREIKEEVGASSTSVVAYHLRRLEQQGLIIRGDDDGRGRKARHIRLAPSLSRAGTWASLRDKEQIGHSIKNGSQGMTPQAVPIPIPLVGQIVAGQPIPSFSEAFPDESVEIPQSLLPRTARNLYALRVNGNSMIDALISDGDIVVLQEAKDASPGEMVAVWLKDTEESTLKRFSPEYDKDNQLQRIILKPANPTMQPIVIDDPSRVEIRGKVVLVIRTADNTIGKARNKSSTK